ncbi:MAG TPA: response regulator [Pirellulales bacterium]
MSGSHKPSVLIVDDEPDILFSLHALLRREFDLATAESGREALKSLAHRPTHVLLTDQRMPGMTGAELLAQSRRISPQTVSIMFTGYADIKAVIEAVNRGHIFRYLTKPWDPDDLLAVLWEAAAHYEQLAERQRLLGDVRAFVAESAAANGQESSAQAHELLQRLDRAVASPPPAIDPYDP